MAAWIGIGGGLLALIIAIVVIVLLVTNKSSSGGTTTINTPVIAGLPADVVRDYYRRLGRHDFAGAATLLTPAAAAANPVTELERQTLQAEQETGAKFQSVAVTDVHEQGDVATATATVTATNGQTRNPFLVILRKTNGKWLIDEAQELPPLVP